MPSRFRSGEETTQFDQMTTGQAREELHRMSVELSKTYRADQVDEMFKERDDKIQGLVNIQAFHRDRISHLSHGQKDIYDKLHILLNSKLVRFLNFFGQWFIYGDNGCVYLNRTYNEKYGKAPALTRFRRWFKKTFTKNGIEVEQKDGYAPQFVFIDETPTTFIWGQKDPSSEENGETKISDSVED